MENQLDQFVKEYYNELYGRLTYNLQTCSKKIDLEMEEKHDSIPADVEQMHNLNVVIEKLVAIHQVYCDDKYTSAGYILEKLNDAKSYLQEAIDYYEQQANKEYRRELK